MNVVGLEVSQRGSSTIGASVDSVRYQPTASPSSLINTSTLWESVSVLLPDSGSNNWNSGVRGPTLSSGGRRPASVSGEAPASGWTVVGANVCSGSGASPPQAAEKRRTNEKQHALTMRPASRALLFRLKVVPPILRRLKKISTGESGGNEVTRLQELLPARTEEMKANR
ncbi:MAG: hypothetical protein WC840_05460 [Candidatus Peribacteraceae bacterium]